MAVKHNKTLSRVVALAMAFILTFGAIRFDGLFANEPYGPDDVYAIETAQTSEMYLQDLYPNEYEDTEESPSVAYGEYPSYHEVQESIDYEAVGLDEHPTKPSDYTTQPSDETTEEDLVHDRSTGDSTTETPDTDESGALEEPEDYPTEEYPTEEYPTEEYPTEDYPSEEYPTEEHPTEDYPTEEYPTEEYPTEDYPTEEYPTDILLNTALPLPRDIAQPFMGQTSYDLSNFVTNVTVTDTNGQPVSDINIGDSLNFRVDFAEDYAGLQFAKNSDGVMVFQWPAGANIANALTNVPILNEYNVTIGHYNLFIDGRLEVRFRNVDIHGQYIFDVFDRPINFIDYYLNASFYITIRSVVEFVPGGEIYFGMGNRVVISDPPEPLVHKNTIWNRAQDRFEVTIDIRALSSIPLQNLEMTIDNMHLSRFAGNVSGAQHPIINPANNSAITNFRYSIVGDTPNTGTVTYAHGANQVLQSFSYDFDGFVVRPGDTLRIVYYVDILKLIENNPDLRHRYNFAPLSMHFFINSDVTISSNAPNTVSDDANVRAFRTLPTYITKAGGWNHAERTVRWTATVGNGRQVLNGELLEDFLDHSEYRVELPTDLTEIEIQMFRRPSSRVGTGSVGAIQDNVSFHPTNDLIGTFTAADFPTRFERVDDNTFTFLVPDDGEDIYRVRFIYNTYVGIRFGIATPSLRNGIYHRYNGVDYHAYASVIVGTHPLPHMSHNRNSGIMQLASGEYVINYTTTIHVPAHNLGHNFWMRTEKGFAPNTTNAGVGTLNNRVSRSILDFNPQVSIYPPLPDGEVFEYSFMQMSNGLWVMLFGTANGTSTADSVWQFTEPKVVTLNYTMPLNTPTAGGTPVEALLRANTPSQLRSVAQLARQGGTFGQTHGAPVNWLVYRRVTRDAHDPNVFHHVVDINVFRLQNPRSRIWGDINNDAILEEVFDPRKELVPYSMFIEREAPSFPHEQWGFFGPYIGSGPVHGPNARHNDNALYATNGFFRINLNNFHHLGLRWASNANFYIESQAINVGAREPYLVNTHLQSNASTAAGAYLFLHFSTRVINPAEITEDTTFDHTISAVTNYRGIDGHTARFPVSTSVNYIRNHLRKNMIRVGSSNQLDVEIVINQHGEKLGPVGSNITQFAARDTMSENLAFQFQTLTIQTQDRVNGNWNGIWRDQPINPIPGGLWSVNVLSRHQFEVEVPNETPVRLTYQVIVTAPADAPNPDLSNEIYLTGIMRYASSVNNFTVATGAGAVANRGTMTLQKNDETTGDSLSGARFALYVHNIGQPGNPPGGLSGSPRIIGGLNFFPANISNTTGIDGRTIFNHQVVNSNFNFLYMLVETHAPSGYMLPTDGGQYTFFVFAGSPAESDVARLQTALRDPHTGFPNAEIHREADIVVTTNERNILHVPEPLQLEIQKAASQDIVHFGETFTYMITVTNTGTSTATNFRVVDILPLQYIDFGGANTVTVSGGSSASPIFVEPSGELVVLFHALGAGESATIEFDAAVRFEAIGRDIPNRAVIYDSDGNEMDYDDEIVTVPNSHTPTIMKSANDSIFSVGDTVYYTIEVHNPNPFALHNFRVIDRLPPASQISLVAVSGATGYNVNLGGGAITVDFPVLPVGTTTITYRVVLQAGAFDQNVINTAHLYDASTPGSPVEVDNDDEMIVVPPAGIHLPPTIVKTVDQAAVPVGEAATFTLTINNPNSVNLEDHQVVDRWNANLLRFVPNSVYINGDSVDASVYTIANGVLTIHLATLSPGNTVITYRLEMLPAALVSGMIRNDAVLYGPPIKPGEPERPPVDDDHVHVFPDGYLNPTITKTANLSSVSVGDEVTYTLTVTNPNPMGINNYVAVDTWNPAHLRFVPGSVSVYANGVRIHDVMSTYANGVLRVYLGVHLGVLPPGNTVITYRLEVLSAAAGQNVPNVVTLYGPPTDPNDPTTRPSVDNDDENVVVGENPSNPTNPSNPSNPTAPTNPTNVTDPTDPTEPSDPTNVTDPTEPSNPTNTTNPSNPTNTTDPNEPTNSTDPLEPTSPSDPTEPTNPTTSTNPSNPSNPTSTDPTTSTTPDNSTEESTSPPTTNPTTSTEPPTEPPTDDATDTTDTTDDEDIVDPTEPTDPNTPQPPTDTPTGTPTDTTPPTDSTIPNTPQPPDIDAETPSYFPNGGGTDPDVAPDPTWPDHTLVQYGDIWLELDELGVPLGAWHWDDDEGMWIFDPEVPLGAFNPAASLALLPQTGLVNFSECLTLMMGLAMVIAIASLILIKHETATEAKRKRK